MLKCLVILLLFFSPTLLYGQNSCWVNKAVSCDDLAIQQIGIVGGSCSSKTCIPIGMSYFCPVGVGLDSNPGNNYSDIELAGQNVAGFEGIVIWIDPQECGRTHVCRCTGAGTCSNSPPGIGGAFKPNQRKNDPTSTPCTGT